MLGCIANRQKKDDKNVKEIYNAQWINSNKKTEKRWFRFSLVADDNTVEKDFNNLSASEGTMQIRTKSLIKFKIDDTILFRGDTYHITFIDGNRKESGEQAFARVKVNGNVPIYINLRKVS